MQQKKISIISILLLIVFAFQFCSKNDTTANTPVVVDPYAAIKVAFATNIDPANPNAPRNARFEPGSPEFKQALATVIADDVTHQKKILFSPMTKERR